MLIIVANKEEIILKSNILIINGHPDPQSYCAALTNAYIEGVSLNKVDIQRIDIHTLTFDPNLQFGYRKRTELEEDLLHAQELIRWADHLVFVYPTWWGAMPAMMKGFIDRVFLPGFAFKYREKSALWDKLLVGKSAHLIVTTDTPAWYSRWVNKHAGYRVMKHNILQFCGITPVRLTEIGPVRPSSLEKRAQWLEKVKRLGAKLA
ncbi:NAD(P)H-dependent oxidoreductase [Paenibacillus qinlingensis]|nr:NAD(P)H-dependent oxidoreductase [Paenibacillus qinlingensis]